MFKKIVKKIKQNYYIYGLLGIYLVAFILFFPSLKNFYTNDDFFHLRISQINSVKEFFNFFNLVKSPEGWGLYRPLTTQVFYFLTIKFFNLNPVPLHIISFLTFFAIIFLVAEFARIVTKNKDVALLSAFLYATSATHFGHLYFLGAYQELGMTLFFLLSVISFIKYELNKKNNHLVLSIIFFILALMSKETAVILPFVLVLVHLFLFVSKEKIKNVKHFIISIIPYFVLVSFYLCMRFKYYGFAQGDSYVWNYSIKRVLNTLFWYKLWSFNIPETLVDFVGPGLNFNPNLFRYWGKEFSIIFSLFIVQITVIFIAVVIKFKKIIEDWKIYLFSIVWFSFSLIPVIFLPVHKFTYYLTLPLIGLCIFIGNLLITVKVKKIFIVVFIIVWSGLSFTTLELTKETNWITQGSKTSKLVFNYIQENKNDLIGNNIIFYDTKDDFTLPFSPTKVVSTSLSGDNFFKVFYDGKINVSYLNGYDKIGNLKSRQFLGY